jgi:hypothetical protein
MTIPTAIKINQIILLRPEKEQFKCRSLPLEHGGCPSAWSPAQEPTGGDDPPLNPSTSRPHNVPVKYPS